MAIRETMPLNATDNTMVTTMVISATHWADGQ